MKVDAVQTKGVYNIRANDVLSYRPLRNESELKEDQPWAEVRTARYRNIKDITQMVNVFAKFRNLQEISLHGNKLTNIPPL